MRILSLILFMIILPLSPLFAEEPPAAKVNGTIITQFELEQATDQLIPRSTYHGSVSELKRAEFREKALNSLIDRELRYQDAVAKDMKPDKKLVKAELEKIRNRYPSKKEYKKALEQAGFTEKSLRLSVEKDVLINEVVRKTVSFPSHMTENEVKEYYSKNIQQFMLPDSVKLRLLSCKEEGKARNAYAKVKAGEDFGTVAATMSEDKFRVMGGDVGYLHRGRLLQELEDVAFTLTIGEISAPVKADDGIWYVMRLEDRQPGRQLSFDETKDRLKQQLERKREQELMTKWIDGLRSKAKIEIISSPAQ